MTEERRCRKKGCGVAPQLVLPSGWCYTHDPDRAEERMASSRRGGAAFAKRMASSGLSPDELGSLRPGHVEDGMRRLDVIAQAVASRRLTHGEGATMVAATREWLRAEDTRLRAVDLRELQAQIAELKKRRGLEAVR